MAPVISKWNDQGTHRASCHRVAAAACLKFMAAVYGHYSDIELLKSLIKLNIESNIITELIQLRFRC